MEPCFSLKVIQGYDAGKEFLFESNNITIGRSSYENDLALNSQDVSSFHARIFFHDDKYYIEDLQSTNGTFVNGIRLEGEHAQEILEDGFEFFIASFCFKFCISGKLEKTIIGNNNIGKIKKQKKLGKKRIFLKGKPVIVTGIIVFCLFVFLLVWDNQNPSKDAPVSDRQLNLSNEPVKLPNKSAYGYLPRKRIYSRPDRVQFVFNAKPGGAYLKYTTSHINSASEVSILLNGHKIGNASISPGTWGKETTLHLPKTLLQQTGTNNLTFDNLLNPGESDTWAVKKISIVFEQKSVCDVNEARRLVELAENACNERLVSAKNLFVASQYYSNALIHLDGCQSPPELYNEIGIKLGKIKKDIEHQYNRLLFSLKKNQKLNNNKRSIEILEEIISLIPDSKDSRHKAAADMIPELKKNKGK